MNANPSFSPDAVEITAPARDPLMARMDQLIRINRKERALAREAVAAGEVGGERAAHAVLMAHVCREMGVA